MGVDDEVADTFVGLRRRGRSVRHQRSLRTRWLNERPLHLRERQAGLDRLDPVHVRHRGLGNEPGVRAGENEARAEHGGTEDEATEERV